MFIKLVLFTTLIFGIAFPCVAQKESKPVSKPIELQVLKDSVGVWDAEVEVWPQGLDSPSMKFKGVETNRAFGEHWIASDLDSEFMGHTTTVHSIVGYDLDQRKMVGKVIDEGPYAASMSGDYDQESKSVRWTTTVKDANGEPIVQRTVVTQKSADERILVLSVPNKEKKDEFVKFMQIKFVKRK